MTAGSGVLVQVWSLIVIASATSLVSDSNGTMGHKDDYVAEPLVENLGVVAVEHDAATRSLQLYVNWTAPAEGRLPKNYTLIVTSINKSADYCVIMDFVEDINSTVTSLLVPPEVSGVENDPRVQHECAYKLRVESSPYDGRAAELNYTVPELVGSLWSCRGSSALPVPRKLDAKVVDHAAVDVAWEVDAGDAQTVQGFSLKLGTEIVSQVRDLFDYTPEVLLDVGNWSADGGALHMEHRLQADLRSPVDYKLQVRVVDRRGCRGPPAEARFHSADSESSSSTQTVVFVVVPVVLVAAVGAGLLCRRYCWQTAGGRRGTQPAQPWLDGYSSVVAQRNGQSSLPDVASRPETELE